MAQPLCGFGQCQYPHRPDQDRVQNGERRDIRPGNIITIYLAARLALANELTVGMIFAFMAYKHQFTDKAVLLVEKALELRILGLHLERLSDIALNPLERGHDRPLTSADRSAARSSCATCASAMRRREP